MAAESEDAVTDQSPSDIHEANAAVADDELEVLEFVLAETQYCVEIEYVAEVVEMVDNELTRIPNTPEAVAGVMDLRGETTTIVDPKQIFDVTGSSETDLILVFDENRRESEECMGWMVDDVIKVSHIDPETVDNHMNAETGIEGIVNRGSEFVLWIDPETAITPRG